MRSVMYAKTSNVSEDNIVDFQAYVKRKRLGGSTGEGLKSLKEKGEATGEELFELKQRVGSLESTVKKIQEKVDERKASPENIYRLIDDAAVGQQSDNTLLKARELLQIGLQHLEQALHEFPDEIEREAKLDLFFNNIRRLTLIPFKSRNFEDAITALLVALQGTVTEGYSREKIIALRNVTKVLMDNIFMSEEVLDKCIDKLEESGFDLSLPFKGIDFYDLL